MSHKAMSHKAFPQIPGCWLHAVGARPSKDLWCRGGLVGYRQFSAHVEGAALPTASPAQMLRLMQRVTFESWLPKFAIVLLPLFIYMPQEKSSRLVVLPWGYIRIYGLTNDLRSDARCLAEELPSGTGKVPNVIQPGFYSKHTALGSWTLSTSERTSIFSMTSVGRGHTSLGQWCHFPVFRATVPKRQQCK